MSRIVRIPVILQFTTADTDKRNWELFDSDMELASKVLQHITYTHILRPENVESIQLEVTGRMNEEGSVILYDPYSPGIVK